MNTIRSRFLGLALLAACTASAAPTPKPIPDALKPWQEWATWSDEHRDCPTPFSDAKKHLCFWPSRMGLQVEKAGGKFDVVVTVFHETWVPLPGNADAWPVNVTADGKPLPVTEHEGNPAIQLGAGTVHLEGAFRWSDVPQRIKIPREVGILAVTLDGQPVAAPTWDAQGFVWLKRGASTEEADKNFLSVKLNAAIEDGIPLWLRTEIELTVAGKSREEEIGVVLPEGWKLASVESAIPVSIDAAGKMKAQVRAGKWTVHADAFRFDNPKEFRYAEGAKPAVEEELIAFRAQPDFRTVEINGAPAIDVSQTTFPDQWRGLPVYRWETATPFQLAERMRGMGDQKPAGLKITRELWLDEDGRALTFRDVIAGQMQQIWRLDAAAGQDLGSVRSGGQGQLITRNPQTSAPGVEIRTRNLNLDATGRMTRAGSLSATGWQSDADALAVTLNLPPGWRLFALFGADWVRGDWLTAWTLLDLFLLLVFTLAVFRLWGFFAAVLAFIAFGLSFHEPGAPRYLWLILLVPLALQRVVPEGWGRRLVGLGKWIAVGAFVFVLVPFIAEQVQQALYPQLENVGQFQQMSAPTRDYFANEDAVPEAPSDSPEDSAAVVTKEFKPKALIAGRMNVQEFLQSSGVPFPPGTSATYIATSNRLVVRNTKENLELISALPLIGGNPGRSAGTSAPDNLGYDASARIQTGPGVPEWKWRAVSFGWNGPVSATQQVRPVLISLTLERVLTTLRVVLMISLAGILLGARKIGGPVFRAGGKVALVLGFVFVSNASAQSPIPDQTTLQKLRERLLETSDAYPNAADIPSVTLTLNDGRITIDAEIHAALRVAVPLPGKLPAWSPLNVLVDDKPEVALRRDDGFLWVVIEPGVHRVRAEGSLANVTEWEWTFLLKPRQVKIDAPGWNITGVRPDGVPEAQVFFVLKQKAEAAVAAYERQDLKSIVVIDRTLELGLIWQVRTNVARLSPTGKAVALRVPLLPGENVLSADAIVKDGFIEVRLGAQEQTASWESGLAVVTSIQLATRADDAWVERWHLVASPVWNVAISGLAPVFEPSNADLVPVWQPWPGESVSFAISRPEAITGATMTVDRGTHTISLGKRQRVSKLDLSLRCSLGEDFLVQLPAEAEVTALLHNGKAIPVRKDGGKLVIPVRPGEQSVSIGWKTNVELGARAQAEAVQLPVESANIQTEITVPGDRWVLWANGPRRGPAVRFWGILICSLLAAIVLGRIAWSPIRTIEWMLLVIGLTQVPLPAALAVVGWLFFLGWRGGPAFQKLGNVSYNALQIFLIALTVAALGVLFTAVGEGLLGRPEMFIVGNDSTQTTLRWFQARCETLLPRPGLLSISIWWYRFFMLAWALWLAASLVRWLGKGWKSFGSGGFFHRTIKVKPASPPPPPLPVQP